MCVCVRVYMCVYIHTHIHTYTHARIFLQDPTRTMPVYELDPISDVREINDKNFILDFNDKPRFFVGRNFHCEAHFMAEFMDAASFKVYMYVYMLYVCICI